MNNSLQNDSTAVCDALTAGETAVVRTDTLYGLIARAHDAHAVQKVYDVKQRNPEKQCIILISAHYLLTARQPITIHGGIIEEYTRRAQTPLSVIVPASNEPSWLLSSNTDSVAYRLVRDPFLCDIIATVGPIIAPSANPEGEEPAHTITQAYTYFGDAVGCYVDGGAIPKEIHASKIVKVHTDGHTEVIRD